MRPFTRKLLHPVFFIGSLLALVGFVASVVLLLVDVLSEEVQPYRGIFTFFIFPVLLFLGIALMGLGLVLEYRRAKRLGPGEWRPVLDWRRRRHRRIITSIGVFMGLLFVASLVGGMRAYEYTESVNFCGETCHEPMEPQYTAYQHSPHAQVACTDCHVGPEFMDYVDAKLAGLNQVYAVLTNSYHGPIRLPREQTLPAKKTCERCHWPEKFWGTQLDERVRFGYDLRNSRRWVKMLMKTGGGSAEGGRQQGIHWHMNIENAVYYRTPDPQAQVIPWVRVERPDGTSTTYLDAESPVSETELAALDVRRMDCLDCHNRPAHRFPTPDHAVDDALAAGRIDPSLPFIKKVAVEALATAYPSREEGLRRIRERLEGFYEEHFAGRVLERRTTLERAIETVQEIFRRSAFPSMNVGPYTYPDNVGHREFPGCFRCHNGRHRSESGEVLVADCASCHLFVESARDSASLIQVPADGTPFHPWTSVEEHRKLQCWECHTGAASPYHRCAECHEEEVGAHTSPAARPMAFECSICHSPGGSVVKSADCARCHPTGDSPMHVIEGHADCLACHKPHGWEAGKEKAACDACHADLPPDHYPEKPCLSCHSFQGMQALMMGLPAGNR